MRRSPILTAAILVGLTCALPACSAGTDSDAPVPEKQEGPAPGTEGLSPYDIATADAVLDEPETRPIPDSALVPEQG